MNDIIFHLVPPTLEDVGVKHWGVTESGEKHCGDLEHWGDRHFVLMYDQKSHHGTSGVVIKYILIPKTKDK